MIRFIIRVFLTLVAAILVYFIAEINLPLAFAMTVYAIFITKD